MDGEAGGGDGETAGEDGSEEDRGGASAGGEWSAADGHPSHRSRRPGTNPTERSRLVPFSVPRQPSGGASPAILLVTMGTADPAAVAAEAARGGGVDELPPRPTLSRHHRPSLPQTLLLPHPLSLLLLRSRSQRLPPPPVPLALAQCQGPACVPASHPSLFAAHGGTDGGARVGRRRQNSDDTQGMVVQASSESEVKNHHVVGAVAVAAAAANGRVTEREGDGRETRPLLVASRHRDL